MKKIISIMLTLCVIGLGVTALASPASAGKAGIITGVVTDSSGVPLQNICVRATGSSYTSPSVDTNVAGVYTLGNVPAGTNHVIRFSDCHATSNPYVTQYYLQSATQAGATFVTASSGQTTSGINAVMSTDGVPIL